MRAAQLLQSPSTIVVVAAAVAASPSTARCPVAAHSSCVRALMKTIDKLSECEDKLLDPRTLSFRLKKPIRRRINDLLSRTEEQTADGKLAASLQEILDREEDQKNLLSYDDVSEMHRCLQRLDSTYRLFFHQLLDECRAFVTDERDVSMVTSEARQGTQSPTRYALCLYFRSPRSLSHSFPFLPFLSPHLPIAEQRTERAAEEIAIRFGQQIVPGNDESHYRASGQCRWYCCCI